MKTYRGFLSYSHYDSKLVARLHKQLEYFKFAATKKAKAVRLCSPIFRDRKDLGDTPHLREGIIAAIKDSDCLIVACTPRASASDYVTTEIREFISAHPAGKIIVALLEGTGEARDPQNWPAALSEHDHIEIVDLRSSGEGFNAGSLKVAAHVSGVEFQKLRDFDARRRSRNMTASGAAFTLGLGALGLVLFATAYIVGNTYNSAIYTYYGLFILNDASSKMLALDRYPGPTERVSIAALDHTADSVEQVAQSPGLRFIPGSQIYIDNFRWAIAQERFRIYYLSGQTGEALTAAETSVARFGDIKAHLSPWSALILRWQLHKPVTIPLELGRAEAATYLNLSLAQSSAGDYVYALANAKRARQAAEITMRRSDSTYEDRTKFLDIEGSLANIAATVAPDEAQRTAALDKFLHAAEALPQKGECCDGYKSWSNLRASYIAQARIGAVWVESSKHNEDRVVTLVPDARQAIDDLAKTPLATPGYLAYLKMALAQGYTNAARTANDRLKARQYAEDALTGAQSAVAQGVYTPFADEALSVDFMADALAKAQARDASYLQSLQQSISVAQAMTEQDPYSFRTKYLVAVRMSDAAAVFKTAGKCEISNEYAKSAIDRLKALQKEEPLSQTVRDEIKETQLYSTCH